MVCVCFRTYDSEYSATSDVSTSEIQKFPYKWTLPQVESDLTSISIKLMISPFRATSIQERAGNWRKIDQNGSKLSVGSSTGSGAFVELAISLLSSSMYP